jgi:plastocyanin
MRAAPSVRAGLGALLLAIGLVGLVGVSNASAASIQKIELRDDCDPLTFNAAIGPGACVGNGHMTFATFLDRLGKDRMVGAWKFNPDKVEIKRGTPLSLTNRGGETHTFTCVKAFGGGIVPLLNDLSGNPKVAELCPNEVLANTFVPAGGSLDEPAPQVGTHLYQCMIHPWMRTTLTVKPD